MAKRRIPEYYASTAKLKLYPVCHQIVGRIPSNGLNTFRSAGGLVLQLPIALASPASLEYLADKYLPTIGWETGYYVTKEYYATKCADCISAEIGFSRTLQTGRQ